MIVSVVDDNEAPVTGLGPTDFNIYENGSAREVIHVEPAGANRQISLLVDTSRAASHAIADFRQGLTNFVAGMHEGNEISLITFGGPPRVRVASTTNTRRLNDGIGKLFALSDQAAYMLDAIDQTASGFSRRAAARPIMVVLMTEGLDHSNSNARRVLERINESGAAVYTLFLRLGRNAFSERTSISAFDLRQQEFSSISIFALRQQESERDLVLDRGPKNSGGHHRDLLASLSVEPALDKIVKELRNQYLVVYSRPDSLIPADDITVKVDQEGLTARGTPLRTE